MKKLLRYLKPYTKETVISPLFKFLEAIFDLLVPIVVKLIIDEGIGKEAPEYVGWMTALLCAFAVIGLSCSLIAQFFAARAAVGVSTALRQDLFSHIGTLSYRETDRLGVSTLITRMTGDVNQIQSAINLTLRLLLRSPIIVFGAMIMAFTVNARGAWIFAVVIPLLAAVVFSIIPISKHLYRRVQKNLDRVTSRTRENLSGVRVIRAFRLENEEEERFDEANNEHNRMQNVVGRVSALLNPITLLIVNAGVIVILLSGGKLVEVGDMTQGEVVALTNYMAQILVELVKFANTIFTVNKALASADRVQKVFEIPSGMETVEGAEPLDTDAAIAFSNVSLAYNEGSDSALSSISFSVPRGATVGIIGSTGAGKSSLVNLIPRFYDATEGTVYVDGRDVRSYDLSELRQKIAVVPQKAVLFRGTVRSNLLWGNAHADEETLRNALSAAQALEFVEGKDQGLDTEVREGGTNFSGGQRQRLTVARALVKRAPILILDDSASALDYATEAALRTSLANLPDRPTLLIVSQRTSSIKHADLILVLEDGELVGTGTHDTLLKECEVYREIYETQYKKGGATA